MSFLIVKGDRPRGDLTIQVEHITHYWRSQSNPNLTEIMFVNSAIISVQAEFEEFRATLEKME